MDMLRMVITKETFEKLIPDIDRVSNKYNLRTKNEINNTFAKELDYWVSDVTMNNPIQEAIVLDCVQRIILKMPPTSGLYDN